MQAISARNTAGCLAKAHRKYVVQMLWLRWGINKNVNHVALVTVIIAAMGVEKYSKSVLFADRPPVGWGAYLFNQSNGLLSVYCVGAL